MTPYYADDAVTLYHGDCREVTAWLQADVLITDPPYGYNVKLNGSRRGDRRGGYSPWAGKAIANDHDTSTRDQALAAWGSRRPALVFGSWRMPKPDGTHTVLIWDKGPGVGMGDLSIPWKPNTEEIYVIGRGFAGTRDTSVLTGHTVVSWASRGREHPNMKPVTLMEALILKSPGGIADPFAGSGSTLVAAKQLGRKAIGVEIDERHCETIAKRLCQDVLDFGGAA